MKKKYIFRIRFFEKFEDVGGWDEKIKKNSLFPLLISKKFLWNEKTNFMKLIKIVPVSFDGENVDRKKLLEIIERSVNLLY